MKTESLFAFLYCNKMCAYSILELTSRAWSQLSGRPWSPQRVRSKVILTIQLWLALRKLEKENLIESRTINGRRHFIYKKQPSDDDL